MSRKKEKPRIVSYGVLWNVSPVYKNIVANGNTQKIQGSFVTTMLKLDWDQDPRIQADFKETELDYLANVAGVALLSSIGLYDVDNPQPGAFWVPASEMSARKLLRKLARKKEETIETANFKYLRQKDFSKMCSRVLLNY